MPAFTDKQRLEAIADDVSSIVIMASAQGLSFESAVDGVVASAVSLWMKKHGRQAAIDLLKEHLSHFETRN